ncbi:hypothetical protein [Delftia sp. WSY_7]|uniref:hypothetical protein n=1 Tax=Delftia sp. WSY_7 TaxID=3367202 RepID=UPI00370C95DE
MMNVDGNVTYHEIDFLLPSQRFNINFSYITHKGLPFVREFVLRLVHLAPLSASQVATFFGFSQHEVREAIEDLVNRDELTLGVDGRLMLTEKANGYFTEVGEVPRLSRLQDSTVCLSFDLATFSCLGKENFFGKWKAGLQISIDEETASRSEQLVEKNFQQQFQQILSKGFLSKTLLDDEGEPPSIYAVNSVSKIKQMPLRLPVKFKLDEEGSSVERDDFEELRNSDYVHEQISLEIDRLHRSDNFSDLKKAALEIGDNITLELLGPRGECLNPQFLEEVKKLETNSLVRRSTFVGPLYAAGNWALVQMYLAPVIKARRERHSDRPPARLVWVAPSDPYWGKSIRLQASISEILDKARLAEQLIYSPLIYLPVHGSEDLRSARQWKRELEPNIDAAHGLKEGFLGGNVELLHFEDEFVAVVYHAALPAYPVSLPFGFVSADKETVRSIGRLLNNYLDGRSGGDQPNDCGRLAQFGQHVELERR